MGSQGLTVSSIPGELGIQILLLSNNGLSSGGAVLGSGSEAGPLQSVGCGTTRSGMGPAVPGAGAPPPSPSPHARGERPAESEVLLACLGVADSV